MDAKGSMLGVTDVLRLYSRKFFRLAIPYYLMWITVWVLQSRITNGPIWHNTDNTFQTCQDHWLSTLFFAGNLYPSLMEPYVGCFPQAFALQIDL